MTADDLKAYGIKTYGPRGWQSKLAARLGVHKSQVSRWARGADIPGPVSAAVKCWIKAE